VAVTIDSQGRWLQLLTISECRLGFNHVQACWTWHQLCW